LAATELAGSPHASGPPTVSPSRRYSRRGFLQASSLAGVALSLGACAGGNSSGGRQLSFWSVTPFVDAVNELLPQTVSAVAGRLGIEVDFQMIPNDQQAARFQTAAESGQLPDVFMLEEVEIPRFFSRGLLSPAVRDAYTRVGDEHGPWVPSAEDLAMIGSDLVAVPFALQPWMAYYRQDLFDRAGVQVPVTGTLDDLLQAARAVHDPASGVHGMAVPMSDADGPGHIGVVNWLFGGGWQNQQGQLTIDTPQNLAALTWYTDLYTRHRVVPQDATAYAPVSNNTAYLNGQAAFIVNTGSVMTSLRDERPDLYDATVVGPWPKGPAGGPAMATGGAAIMIAETSENTELAVDFIAELYREEHFRPILEVWGAEGFPVLEQYAKMPIFTDDPRLRQIVETIVPVARSDYWPGESGPAYSEVFAENAGNVGQMLTSICVSGVAPHEALAGLATVAQRAQERFGG
jgi:multiple sugar transport system substrate-binding protein